ncbi:MAG: ribosome maturation factor RimP [Anaerovoracaceae bacterium]
MDAANIEKLVRDITKDFLLEEDFEIINVIFEQESADWFLRVFIKMKEEENKISTDDCAKLSRFISKSLDEIDPIEQNYYLEVSSPGIE